MADFQQETGPEGPLGLPPDGRSLGQSPSDSPDLDDALLQLREVHAHYDKSHVLHGVSLQLRAGEIVTLLGRNGAGRSTLAKAILGLVPAHGYMVYRGRSLIGLPTHAIARLGVGYVPEQRDVFPRMSVRQNLLLGDKPPAADSPQRLAGRPRWTLEDMWHLFPSLLARADAPAGVLSGGEQQMLTLCRTLMGNPDLVVVDEPTEGLAPMVVRQVAHCLQQLRARGVAVLLIEQKLTIALAIADRALLMGRGQIVFDGLPADLQGDATLQKTWLAV